MNYLGLTVFAGNTPGLILDFYPETKEYLVEFTDGRIIKTAKVFWDKTIPSEPDIAFYRQSNLKNGERLEYDPEIGWDIVSALDEEGIDIVDQPSDLDEWVDDYNGESGEHSKIEEKLDEVLDILHGMEENGDLDKADEEEPSAIEEVDHDATEDSYWDRTLKPNPMAMDNEFGSGQYNERNDGALPGGRAMAAKVAKDCGCWDGYKRVPGTKPCAPGSCEKCDAARKESAAKKKHNPDEAARKVNTVPPAGVRSAAKRGLKYYEEGKAGDGFEAATADRARKIAAGEALTEEHINRMHSFFERHAGGRSKKAKPGEVTAWDVAWLCWGGDAGRTWAAKVDAQFEKARHPNAKKKNSAFDVVSEDAGAGVFDFDNNEDDTDHMRSDIGGNSNVRHAESEADRLMESGDREGNPELRGVGDDATDPDLGEGVEFPSAPDEVIESLLQSPEFEDRIKDVIEEYLSNDEDVSHYAHVREESDWSDKHVGKGFGCPRCSDPLVNNTCYNCGDDHTAYVKRATELKRLASRLVPYADNLAVLLGEAFATRAATTQDSFAEGIFVPVPIHGQDSDPSIGGTGGYNATHGDSPEYLKDVNGIGGWIDATPQDIVKTVVYILDGAIPGFKDKREKAKKKKESSFRVSNAECIICGNTYMEGGECKSPRVTTGQSENGCPAKASKPVGAGNESTTMNPATTAPGVSDTAPMGVSQRSVAPTRKTITPAPSPYGFAASTTAAFDESDENEFDAYHQIEDGGREMPDLQIEPDAEPREEEFVDINGDPVEAGMTYQLFAGDDEEPNIIKIVDVSPDSISVERIDSAFPSDGEEPYDITLEEFQVQDMRLDPKDTVHPNEVGEDSVSPLDGTPETMDDAGSGQNDIPGVSDLSHGRESKLAGRHYYPNQQKEFINELGEARNLDKLVLDGTHYVDGTTTSSESFDDDFLFGA